MNEGILVRLVYIYKLKGICNLFIGFYYSFTSNSLMTIRIIIIYSFALFCHVFYLLIALGSFRFFQNIFI